MDPMVDPVVNGLSSVFTEIAKSGPIALILFILLREQMNKFDKFLTVLDALQEAFSKHTLVIELLTHQCHSVQEDIKRQQDMEVLKASLLKQDTNGATGGGGDDDGIAG